MVLKAPSYLWIFYGNRYTEKYTDDGNLGYEMKICTFLNLNQYPKVYFEPFFAILRLAKKSMVFRKFQKLAKIYQIYFSQVIE